MQKQFNETGFAKLYLWTAKAKFTMGIFFVAFVLAYLFFGFITEGTTASLGFFTAVQMMFACFFIGIAQQLILPTDKLTKPRCILWIAVGVAITFVFSLVFGWFAGFPLWCGIAFIVVLTMGMVAMILSCYLELHRETKLLNKQLVQFQSRTQGML